MNVEMSAKNRIIKSDCSELRLKDRIRPGLHVLFVGINPGIRSAQIGHHFAGYSMSTDPLQFLTWVAARTHHVKLGTMVSVLPWHDPVRLAEHACVLDHLSGGRLILGMGRGLARQEFDGFGVDMAQSRQLFDQHWNSEVFFNREDAGHQTHRRTRISQVHPRDFHFGFLLFR